MLYPHLLKGGLAALIMSGVVMVWSHPAEAGASTGTWRNGAVAGPYGPGYYGQDGSYYGDGRSYRRRAYNREYHRAPHRYGGYHRYYAPYPQPRVTYRPWDSPERYRDHEPSR